MALYLYAILDCQEMIVVLLAIANLHPVLCKAKYRSLEYLSDWPEDRVGQKRIDAAVPVLPGM